MTTEKSRPIENELREAAGRYLSGEMAFPDLWRLAGEVIPDAVASRERYASWLAGGVMACDVESGYRSGDELTEFRRNWIADLFRTQTIRMEATDD